MRAFLRMLTRRLEAGEGAEAAVVVSSEGSAPRGAGAVMAVFPGGDAIGTIGGGNAEYEAQKLSAALLAEGRNALRRFPLVQGGEIGMACGGALTVLFRYLPGGGGPALDFLRRAREAAAGDGPAWLALRLEGEEAVRAVLADRRTGDVPPDLLGDKALSRDGWLCVPLARPGKVYIFGGGHVSQALVPALAAAGFRAVVYDDRAEFTDKALFPGAEGTVCAPFSLAPRRIAVTPDDYVVVMTRGHQADCEVLAGVLRSGARYLGCIGSRRKLALCRERLLAAGFTEEEYARLHAPIGLAIGAETPEEIAVSVTAELIAVRAGLNPRDGGLDGRN